MAATQVTSSGGMTTPLLDNSNGRDTPSRRYCTGSKTTLTYLAGLFAAGGWGFIYFCYQNILMLFAASLGAFFSIFLSYIVVKNDKIVSVQHAGGQMRDTVDQVAESNKTLSGGTDSVKKLSERLEYLQKQLESIAGQQGTNVEALIELVRRNRAALNDMHEISKAEAAQKLVELVIECDKDGNFVIDEQERESLYLNLSTFKTYITVHEKNFFAAIEREKGEIQGVMEMVKTLVEEDAIPEEEKIFFIDDYIHTKASADRRRTRLKSRRATNRRTRLL